MKLFYFIIFLSLTLTSHEAQTKWHKYLGNPILEKGETGSWEDRYVLYQHVLWDGTEYKMWYMGFDGGTKAIGLATSVDGINWEKYENNPVLEKGASGEWDDEDFIVGINRFQGNPHIAGVGVTAGTIRYGGWVVHVPGFTQQDGQGRNRAPKSVIFSIDDRWDGNLDRIQLGQVIASSPS